MPPSAPAPLEDEKAASWAQQITGPSASEPLPDTEVRELAEDDLLAIFLDEAREVLQSGGAAIRSLQAQPQDVGELTVLRRAFHTLKGSSRMVGLNDFGEAAWAFEQVLNSWLADQQPATPLLLSFTGEAMRDFGQWVEAIAAGGTHAWTARPFVEAAERLRRGEPPAVQKVADIETLQDAARQLAAADLPEAAPAPVVPDAAPTVLPHLPDLDLDWREVAGAADADEPAGELATDFLDLDELPSAPGEEAPPAPAAGVEGLDDLDLSGSLPPAPAAPEDLFPEFDEPRRPAAEPVADEPAPPVPAFALDDLQVERAASRLEDEAQEAAALRAAEDARAEAAVEAAAAEAARAQAHAEAARAPAPSREEAPQPATAEARPLLPQALEIARAPVDDSIKVIGPLRIGQALYNVYLTEADEWSARLVADLDEWAHGHGRRLSDATVALAHSLAGSSATVGFHGLSNMARLMENALSHLQGSTASVGQARQLCAAAEEMRQLLHQFAAGLLKEPAEATLDLLRNLAQSARAPVGEPQGVVSDPAALADAAAEPDEPSVPAAVADVVDTAPPAPTMPTEVAGSARADDLRAWEASLDFDVPPEPAPFAPGASVEAHPDRSRSDPGSDAPEPPLTPDPFEEALAAELAAWPREAPAADALPPDDLLPEWEEDSLEERLARAGLAPDAGEEPPPAVAAPAEAEPVAEPQEAAAPEPVPAGPSAAPTLPAMPVVSALAADASDAATPAAAGQGRAEVSLDEGGGDLHDGIDPELFPIFDEEAHELLPHLGSALRQWMASPADAAPRASALRTLHTLKGSARLAGAMRLGERAHRLESDIEAMPADQADARAIEGLLARFDALEASLEVLRAAAGLLEDAAPAATDALVADLPPVEPVRMASPLAAPAPEAEADEAGPEEEGAEGAAAATPLDAAADVPAGPAAPPAMPTPVPLSPARHRSSQAVRIRTQLLDRLVAQAGEVLITRSRLESQLGQLRSSMTELSGNLDRLRQQLRDVEVQAETQMQSRLAQARDSQQNFDPLEFDRFTRVQELTRMMAESVNDVATIQRTLQKTMQATEDDLSAQARQTREMQRGLLRTRMVEFEGAAERLYRVVRQAAKDTGKQVRLDIVGGTLEMDRGVLDRMLPAFEHLLRNCVAHGIESPEARERAGKEPAGLIEIELGHAGNDVSVEFRDDGAGIDAQRVAERAAELGLVPAGQAVSEEEAAELIFRPGFSTAREVSELAGRGIGMDVVRAQVAGLGGRIETRSERGRGTRFRLVLPLTTAVTHVVMLRVGHASVGVPANLIELVQRVGASDTESAYRTLRYRFAGEELPFYSGSALLQGRARGRQAITKTNTVVVVKSASQRIALHVDEVIGNQEVVVKNLGPQLSRLPGMAGISVLTQGEIALIFNPVALAAVHGERARVLQAQALKADDDGASLPQPVRHVPLAPLVLVVDDSITVRRVTQRLLQREGFRVMLASDGLQALERLQQERPSVVLSDIEMPRMDGFDLARNIRADVNVADLPIIMITSRIAEKHREHARTLGVNHYLGKPYSEEELLRLVRHYAELEHPALA